MPQTQGRKIDNIFLLSYENNIKVLSSTQKYQSHIHFIP